MKFLKGNNDDSEKWLPISDLMSVLMMVFILISIAYMLKVESEKQKIKEIAVASNELQNKLYDDLNLEFEKDLEKWDAELDKSTLSIRFNSPEILFDVGSADLKPDFKKIIDNFFPRFMNILLEEAYKDEIAEIRIEGHTSSKWRGVENKTDAYILNMDLSQNRTKEVLTYILKNQNNKDRRGWVMSYVTANGLSSSKPITNEDGTELFSRSRRVEFRVKTKAEDKIAKILTE